MRRRIRRWPRAAPTGPLRVQQSIKVRRKIDRIQRGLIWAPETEAIRAANTQSRIGRQGKVAIASQRKVGAVGLARVVHDPSSYRVVRRDSLAPVHRPVFAHVI